MSFALLESDCGAERGNDFAVLIWEHGSQVELELASRNVPDDGRRMRAQPRSQFLWPEFVVRNVERRGLHYRARQRTTSDLSAAFAYRRLKR
jgi:hypothetical protein